MAAASGDDLPVKPHELEFFAGEEIVTIIPNFSLEDLNSSSTLQCIGGVYGPFDPNCPVDVPLWLALSLHSRNKCRITVPEWLKLENLTRTLEQEKESANEFQEVPFYYVEVGHLLLMHAKDSFGEEHYQTRDVYESLRNTRWSKIQEGLKMLNDALTVRMNNLSATECCLIRTTFLGALDTFQRLKDARQQTQGTMPTPLSM